MKKTLLILAALFMSGCYEPLNLAPVCFRQDDIAYRAHVEELCPDPMEVNEAVMLVKDVAGLPEDYEFHQDIVYSEKDFIEIDGAKSVGLTYTFLNLSYIANTDYNIPILRHELFHQALWNTTGDTDYAHSDERWALVN